MKTNRQIVRDLKAEGFDLTTITKGVVHVRCSQCQSLVICGVSTHERGCPNARHECEGCNELVPLNQRYCADCMN
jgi:hypothetical protein